MSTKPAAEPKKILLVDEQPGHRQLVTLILSRLGYAIDAVATMGEALERLAAGPYEVGLLSASLPDAPGAAAAERARALPGRERLPILMIGSEDGALRSACVKAGAQGYLARPMEIEPLLRSIKGVMVSNTATADDRDPPEEPVVDLSHLASFTDGDRQLEGELAALYLSSAELYLERMGEALASGQSWSAHAHALKGASNNLGARRVARLAAVAEHAAASEARLGALRRAVAEVRGFFDARGA